MPLSTLSNNSGVVKRPPAKGKFEDDEEPDSDTDEVPEKKTRDGPSPNTNRTVARNALKQRATTALEKSAEQQMRFNDIMERMLRVKEREVERKEGKSADD